MKNKKTLIIFLIIFIVIFLIIKMTNNSEANSNKIIEKTTKIAKVENQTILATLTAPAEVKSSKTEKIALDTSKYFSTICAEVGEKVKSGGNLLKYSDGTYITAPYDCVILEISTPKTNTICDSENFISISSLEDLYIEINISEEQLNKVAVGQEVQITSNYDEIQNYTGTISKINSIGTYSAGGTYFGAIVNIKNDGTLKLGMSATSTVVIEKNENIPCLPIEAIFTENQEKYVNLVQSNGETKKTKIKTGIADSNYVQILSGVSLGDTVKYETQTVKKVTTTEQKNNLTQIFTGGKNDFHKGGF